MNVVAQQAWYRLYSFMTLRGALSLLVVLAAMIPLVYVISNALLLDLAGWRGLWSSRLPGLLWNTLSLAGVSRSAPRRVVNGDAADHSHLCLRPYLYGVTR